MKGCWNVRRRFLPEKNNKIFNLGGRARTKDQIRILFTPKDKYKYEYF